MTVYRTDANLTSIGGQHEVKYDQEVDVLTIEFSSAPVEESDEDKPLYHPRLRQGRQHCRHRILNASKRMKIIAPWNILRGLIRPSFP
ncbi:MAG: DUF2283 domain-containing protein [Nitrospirales bacterium]|nr:DUF2283 domain-containing protein [Nitrospirales bacterium]